MNLDQLGRALRTHRVELLMFLIGAALFASGFFVALVRSGRVPIPDPAPDAPTITQAAPSVRVGPADEFRAEELKAYIGSRSQHLTTLAATKPRQEATGIISFTAYLHPQEAAETIAGHRLESLAAQVRIPLQGFEPVQLELGSRNVADAVREYADQARSQLRSELDELEKIIPTVTDESFRRVYEEDAELHRQAIELLDADDPPIVLALVTRGTLANLASAAKERQVRLVDIADEPDAGLRSHTFVPIRPER